MVVSHDGQFVGVIGLADTLRKDVEKTMGKLRQFGVEHLVMLTGDKKAVADRIAAQVGLTDVEAELLPEDKLTRIKALQQKFGSVAMIGDGVNDAPALATGHRRHRDGRCRHGRGAGDGRRGADGDDVGQVPFAVGLARQTRRIILQNLTIALGVIVLLIAATTTGTIGIGPAVVLHEGSTLVVIANALRLLAYR